MFDFDRDGGNVYMTMELMEGKPLDKFIRGLPENPIPVEEALRISNEMGQALSYAHRKGIVHSDFKPGNVFLIKNNAVKVLTLRYDSCQQTRHKRCRRRNDPI